MVTTRSSGRDLVTEKPNGVRKRGVEQLAEKDEVTNGNAHKRPNLRDTDHTRWRMRNDDGRQTWHYLEDDEAAKEWPLSNADKWYLGLPLVRFVSNGFRGPFRHLTRRWLIFGCPGRTSRYSPSPRSP